MEGKRKIDWTGVASHLGWALAWTVFILIWGKWKWRTAEFGTPEWWFDNVGHALGGLMGAVNFLYELNYFFPTLLERRSREGRILRWVMVYVVTPLAVGHFFAVLFEVGEMIHDFQWYATQAQKGGADTTIDILLTFIFAYPGIFLKQTFSKLYERRYSVSEEINERMRQLEDRKAELYQERRLINREIRDLRRRQIKTLFRPPQD